MKGADRLMDIGAKLKGARNDAGLTQEQIAEALGVSRQTVSNWENGRTYPDIISVIKMSDIYNISLDLLLKEREEKPVSDYLNYLEESTNMVKSRSRLGKIILIAAYLVIWAVSVAFFWLAVSGSDAGVYSLLVMWGVIPVTTFVVSLLIAANGYWGRGKWFSALIFGVMYMLVDVLTFLAANTASFGKINVPDFTLIPIGAVISAAGLALGTGIKRLKDRGKDRKQEK